MSAVAAHIVSVAQATSTVDVRHLSVQDVIAHRVFARQPDKTVPPPKIGKKLIKLNQEGRDAIQRRITAAIGNKTHGVELSIERTDAGSFFHAAADLITVTKVEDFISGSERFAHDLSKAQGQTGAPAGMLAIIRGKVGDPQRRYLAAIKADVHDGFGAIEGEHEVDMQYLESLLLTGGQKLYKVGLLVELVSGPRAETYDPANYRALLFDHLITKTETKDAAAYFYDSFLGMGIQKSARKLTKDFFDLTTSFINTSSLDAPAKQELHEALRVELRSSAGTINPAEFASNHIPRALRKEYRKHLDANSFPKNAVVKDTEFVKARLRRPRKLIFETGVKVYVPADAEKDSFTVVKRSPDESLIRIKGSFVQQD